MSRHPHASYGKVNNNKPMRCRRQQEAFTNKNRQPIPRSKAVLVMKPRMETLTAPAPKTPRLVVQKKNQKCWLLPVSEYWHTNPGRDTVQTKSVKYGHRLSCPQHSPSRQGTTTNKMLGAPHSSYGQINSNNNTPACCQRQQEAFTKKNGSPFPGRMPQLSSSQGGKPQLLPPPSSQDSSYRKKQKHWLRVSVTVALLQSVQ